MNSKLATTTVIATDYDVLIAGGGMVGASLAAILAAVVPLLAYRYR